MLSPRPGHMKICRDHEPDHDRRTEPDIQIGLAQVGGFRRVTADQSLAVAAVKRGSAAGTSAAMVRDVAPCKVARRAGLTPAHRT